MNTRIFCYTLFLCLFAFSFSSCDKKDEVSQSANSLQVGLSVNSQNGSSNQAAGYPIMIDASISGSLKGDNLYLHLFQREVNGSDYYYQSSTMIFNGGSASLPVWAGAETDINKHFEIYAVVNNQESYKKVNDVYKVSGLPNQVKARINVYRTQ